MFVSEKINLYCQALSVEKTIFEGKVMNLSLYEINFKELYIFTVVVEQGGFTKAADLLALTQSAVSKNIAKLEEKLDILLFTRDHKNLYITEAGSEFYITAKSWIDELASDHTKLWNLQHKQMSTLKIGLVNNTDLEMYFWPVWQKFKRRFPEVTAEYDTKTLADMTQMILSHELDIVFLPHFLIEKLENLHLPWKWAARDYARVVVPKGHPLEKKPITYEALKDERIVVLNDSSLYNARSLQREFAEHGYELKIGKQFSTPENICRFYTGDDGILLTDVFFDCSKFHEKVVKRTAR